MGDVGTISQEIHVIDDGAQKVKIKPKLRSLGMEDAKQTLKMRIISIQTSSFGLNGREGSMYTSFPSSSIHIDTMQTLYLRNQDIVGYTNSFPYGNMVLVKKLQYTLTS